MPSGIVVSLTQDGSVAVANSVTSGTPITISSVKFYEGWPYVISGNIDPDDPNLGQLAAANAGSIQVSATNNMLQLGALITKRNDITAATMLIGFNKTGTDDGVFAYATFDAVTLPQQMNFVAAVSVENIELESATFSNISFTNIPLADNNVAGGVSLPSTLPISSGVLYDNNNDNIPLVLKPSQVQECINGNYWLGTIAISSNAISSVTEIASNNLVVSSSGVATYISLQSPHKSIVEGKYMSGTGVTTPSEFLFIRDSNSSVTGSLPVPSDGSYTLLLKEQVL